MTEETWQLLVVESLARSMELCPHHFLREVPFRDGSRIDLLFFRNHRVIGFEMKMSDGGEALRSLASRDLRQLRHFGAACDALYLVTLASPRSWALMHDGHVVRLDPLEMQLLPEGVGWIAFDMLTHQSTILVSAPELQPKDADRHYLVGAMETRLGGLLEDARRCR